MISVFTPSHNPKYLDEAYESLKKQVYEDWEWVVLLNGEAHDWWPEGLDDPRVKIVRSNHREGMAVGDAKADAVLWCSGEILVELDHDDILVPGALTLVAKRFEQHPNAGLIYSDFRHINEQGEKFHHPFNPAYGWNQSVDGWVLGFPPVPSAVSYIWYAPNHLRAFSRAAYDAVGGYDRTLDILDDQDLMARLYQYGEFYPIKWPIYLQRVHSEQTQARQDLNARIQTETVQMYDRTIEANALAWAKRRGLKRLDLGGAHNSPPGYQSVDLHDADITGDVMEVLSNMPNNSVGVIRACDFLEHIPNPVPLMNECYRVLRHGGMMLTSTPSTDGRGAFQDPTHVSFWNEHSFWYYTNAEFAKYVPEITCRFQISRLYTDWPRPNIAYVHANLVAIKDGPRLPGELLI